MANFVLNFSGESTDDFTYVINNLRPKVKISGLDANSEILIEDEESSEIIESDTTSDNGTYVFYPKSYGTYKINGIKSSNTEEDVIDINAVKEYALNF